MTKRSLRCPFPVNHNPLFNISFGTTMLAAAAAVAFSATGAMAQGGSVFVDSRSNIFGYGVSTPQPGGGGGGLIAVTVHLTPGIGRFITFRNTGTAWWNSTAGADGPDGGNFANSTNIPAVGPISGYAAPRSGHLVGLYLEAADPTGLPAPNSLFYPFAASLTAPAFSPGLRQVFFIGDGLTGTGSGVTQTFTIPDTATRLVFGVADASNFNGLAGFYNDNRDGYTVNYNAIPSPSVAALLGLGGLMASRRRRVVTAV